MDADGFEHGTGKDMSLAALREAITDILICPICKGRLHFEEDATCVRCTGCQRDFPVSDGILLFLQGESSSQEKERRFRDTLASEYIQSDRKTLLEVIAQHHCVPVMRRQSEEFRAKVKPHEWILDIGIGYGWHWAGKGVGAKILGLDMSMGNLILARQLLGKNDNVVLICADAASLPICDHTISGVWSVQVFQHLPQEALSSVQAELDRVLRDEFVMELYNLNPAWLHKVIYRLLGKRLHCRGRLGEMELNRLSAVELVEVWRQFRGGRHNISHGYSELFFHPNFRLRPRRYPVKLERVLAAHTPKLASLFARQVQVRIEA